MTTFIQFVPTQTQVFTFQAVLDETTYGVRVPYNIFGQRFYIEIFGENQTLVLSRALIGSAIGAQIEAASWLRGFASIRTGLPHGYKVGSIVTLTMTDIVPDAYNGRYECLITGPDTFSYALASNPGVATAFGAASYDVNLVGGLFASTMVFRAPTRRFEIAP